MKTDERPRNIDVLIAELMGCKVLDPESAVPRCECHHHPHSQELSDLLKHYSEDMLSAMEVVEKMRADSFSFKVFQPTKGPEDPLLGHAVVSFVCGWGPCEKHGNPHYNHHGAYNIAAETLPMAICKAALIALGKLPSEERP